MKNLITGDSHTEAIQFNNSSLLLCSAGSAKGLNNPNSISQYNKLIINNINNNNYNILVFSFGSVDVDFSFIHKLIDNPSIDYIEFNKIVIDNYLEFIVNNFRDRNIIILSISLPTLADEYLKYGLLNGHINYLENYNIDILKNKLDNMILPNILERTNISMNFNEQLKNKVISLNLNNIKYLDVTSFTYDDQLKRIKDIFFTKNDHHNWYRMHFYGEIINKFIETNFLV